MCVSIRSAVLADERFVLPTLCKVEAADWADIPAIETCRLLLHFGDRENL
jgi:hypothetical protein